MDDAHSAIEKVSKMMSFSGHRAHKIVENRKPKTSIHYIENVEQRIERLCSITNYVRL
jgi:hypothetical protein